MDLGPRIVSGKMPLPFRIILLVTVLSTIVLCQKSQIRIDPDGGYTGIVIKIDKDVPEDLCPEILTNLKVRKLCLHFHCFFKGNAAFIYIVLWQYGLSSFQGRDTELERCLLKDY